MGHSRTVGDDVHLHALDVHDPDVAPTNDGRRWHRTRGRTAVLRALQHGCRFRNRGLGLPGGPIGPRRVVIAGLSCGVLGFVFLAVGNQSWAAIGVLVAGFGTGSSFSYLLDHIAGYYPPEVRASGLGWASGFGRLAGIAGPSYGGFFVSVGAGDVSIVAWALAVPAAVGALLMSTLPRDGSTPRPSAREPADKGNVEAVSELSSSPGSAARRR